MNNSRKIGIFAGILGFLGVLCGAFGAHALRPRLEDLGMERAWETAVLYHLIHAVALVALAAWVAASAGNNEASRLKFIGWAARCWITGVILFSGSLYIMALGGPRWLGPVTPLGGLALLAGWALVAAAAWRK